MSTRYKEMLGQAAKLAADAKQIVAESTDPAKLQQAEKMLSDAQDLRDEAARANEIVQKADRRSRLSRLTSSLLPSTNSTLPATLIPV